MKKDISAPIHPEKKEMNKKRGELFNQPDPYQRFWDREDTERATLYNCKWIEIHLISGDAFACELLEMGMYVYVINFKSKNGTRKIIIPKHSVDYIVIKENQE